MCVSALCACMECTVYVSGVQVGQMRVPDSVELELGMIVSCYVVSGN